MTGRVGRERVPAIAMLSTLTPTNPDFKRWSSKTMPVVAFNPSGSHLNLTLSKFIGGHDENCTLFERIHFAIDGLCLTMRMVSLIFGWS